MELANKLLSAIFPSRCLLCHKTVDQPGERAVIEICQSCFAGLPHNKTSCICCAVPLADDVTNTVLCGRCIRIHPTFDYAYSPLRYEADVVGLVHQLKFSEKITFARSFGEIMVEFLLSRLSAENTLSTQIYPECILPVPLYKSRLRLRGFNQSIELARVLSKRLHIPIEYDAVRRDRSTTSQTGLDASARRKNIKGAFSVTQNFTAKHILIIDDVMTTGSTVNELAKTLKKNSVERVGVLSFARAPMKN